MGKFIFAATLDGCHVFPSFFSFQLSSNLKDEKELVLYPNKNGTVKTLLEEAAKQIEFSEDSTRKLRLVEVSSHKLYSVLREDTPLESMHNPRFVHF